MGNTIVDKIWAIRGRVNRGIKLNSRVLIAKAYNEIESLYANGKGEMLSSGTLRSLDEKFYYRDDAEKDMQRNAKNLVLNMRVIYNNFVETACISIKYGTKPNSTLEYIWLIRAMIDDVIDKSDSENFDKRKYLEIMVSIEDAINKCIVKYSNHMYDNDEYNSLINLRGIIYQVRNSIFGKEQLVQGFDYYSQNY